MAGKLVETSSLHGSEYQDPSFPEDGLTGINFFGGMRGGRKCRSKNGHWACSATKLVTPKRLSRQFAMNE